MNTPDIRPASLDDVPVILGFIRDLARYERAEDEVEATEETLAASLFSEGATAHAVIARSEGEPVGFAIYFFNYSTWQARNGLYLEDLYVTPDHRGRGMGRALLKHLARIALDAGCGRFEWSVLDWNAPSIRVYEAIGAEPMSEWVRYRLQGERLAALAES